MSSICKTGLGKGLLIDPTVTGINVPIIDVTGPITLLVDGDGTATRETIGLGSITVDPIQSHGDDWSRGHLGSVLLKALNIAFLARGFSVLCNGEALARPTTNTAC